MKVLFDLYSLYHMCMIQPDIVRCRLFAIVVGIVTCLGNYREGWKCDGWVSHLSVYLFSFEVSIVAQ